MWALPPRSIKRALFALQCLAECLKVVQLAGALRTQIGMGFDKLRLCGIEPVIDIALELLKAQVL